MTALSILRAFAENVAGIGCKYNGRCNSSRCLAHQARAALEAAAKAEGLASDEALVNNASYAVYEATKAAPDMSGACRRAHGDLENIRVARAVLRAVDAYQRGSK